MKGLAWKLATIAAVIGIGFLVLLQAQRGMNQALVSKQTDAQATPGQAAPAAPATTAAAKNPPEQAKPDAVADLPFQSEPESASGSKSAPGPTPPPPAAKIAADTGSKSTKTAEIPTATGNGGAPQAANDPFSEFSDSKHPAPPANSKKPDAGAPLDLKPGGDIKQASASTEDKNSKPEAPAPRFPTPTATPGAAQAASPNTPPVLDLKAPSGQSEPGEASPPPSTADQKSGSKDSAGPQLFAPGNGPDLGPPPSGNQPQPSSAGPSLAPPTPTVDNSKAMPQGSPPPQANTDATPFPALDDEPAAPAKAPAIQPDAGKLAPKTPIVQNSPATHPDPFPIDQAKEMPLAKSPETKTVDVAPKTSPVPTLTNASSPSPGPKLADSSAVVGAQASTRPGSDPHPESPADFQGDGTVGEQAPLGPQRPQLSIEKVAPPNAAHRPAAGLFDFCEKSRDE